MNHRLSLVQPLATLILALPLATAASANLALEKGCMSCHGMPPRGKAPTMTELAARYAPFRGNEIEFARLSAHLREHHLFGGVPAHERLSAEAAARFVRWLVNGVR